MQTSRRVGRTFGAEGHIGSSGAITSMADQPDRTCVKCKRVFQFPSRLRKHLQRKTSCAPAEEKRAPNSELACKHCGREFASKWSKNRHETSRGCVEPAEPQPEPAPQTSGRAPDTRFPPLDFDALFGPEPAPQSVRAQTSGRAPDTQSPPLDFDDLFGPEPEPQSVRAQTAGRAPVLEFDAQSAVSDFDGMFGPKFDAAVSGQGPAGSCAQGAIIQQVINRNITAMLITCLPGKRADYTDSDIAAEGLKHVPAILEHVGEMAADEYRMVTLADGGGWVVLHCEEVGRSDAKQLEERAAAKRLEERAAAKRLEARYVAEMVKERGLEEIEPYITAMLNAKTRECSDLILTELIDEHGKGPLPHIIKLAEDLGKIPELN